MKQHEFTFLGEVLPLTSPLLKGDVTQGDSQRQSLPQHSVETLDQCCNYAKQCHNNVATLYCTKNRPCKSSSVTLAQGDVTRDDSQRRFLAQHSVAMLGQCWINVATMRNNVTTMLQRCIALKIVLENRSA